jgi:hypothetical protein
MPAFSDTLVNKTTQLGPHAKALARSASPGAPTAAKSMGWFGVALGLTELLAARKLTGALDIRGREGVVRAMGVREIASGALIARNRRRGMWSRVGGDVLDVAALAAAFPGNRRKRNLGLALGAVVGATLVDVLTARALQRREAAAPDTVPT